MEFELQEVSEQTLFICVPARLASTRLPGKMLEVIGDQTMIEHVCDRVRELVGLLGAAVDFAKLRVQATVLSDSAEILARAAGKGLRVMLSERSHESGTSRIQEFLEKQQISGPGIFVLNIQGDEPFLDTTDVCALLKGFLHGGAAGCAIGTLAYRNGDFSQFLNPSCVKVVLGAMQHALYFSRAPVPWPRALLGTTSLEGRQLEKPAGLPADWFFWHHLGIYVYRAEFLLAYTQGGSDCKEAWGAQTLESVEGLEQLAALACGQKIWVNEAKHKGMGIDTADDLARARAWYAKICQ